MPCRSRATRFHCKEAAVPSQSGFVKPLCNDVLGPIIHHAPNQLDASRIQYLGCIVRIVAMQFGSWLRKLIADIYLGLPAFRLPEILRFLNKAVLKSACDSNDI